jgi:hypothetical protein
LNVYNNTMGFHSQDLARKHVICKTNILSGITHWVDGVPLCLGQNRGSRKHGEHCQQPAGLGTDHPGYGKCMYHGGRATSLATIDIRSGRYAHVTGKKLQKLYNDYAKDPEILDLVPELILLRSLLAKVLHLYQDVDLDSPAYREELDLVRKLTSDIAWMVERIDKISASHVLAPAAAKLLMVRAIEVLKRYLPPEQLSPFVQDWRREVINPLSITSRMGRSKSAKEG